MCLLKPRISIFIKTKNVPKQKDNPIFVDGENIPLIQDEHIHFDDYNIPNTSRVDGISFPMPDSTYKKTTSQLRQKVKRAKPTTLYRQLNVTGILDLINLDWSKLTTGTKKRATFFEFYNGDKWVPLTKQTGEFLAPKALRNRFGGVNAMKNVLGIDKAPPALERYFKVATKLRC